MTAGNSTVILHRRLGCAEYVRNSTTVLSETGNRSTTGWGEVQIQNPSLRGVFFETSISLMLHIPKESQPLSFKKRTYVNVIQQKNPYC